MDTILTVVATPDGETWAHTYDRTLSTLFLAERVTLAKRGTMADR